MIKSLHLKYFQKHEDLSINFTEGLNSIRGSNEAGKSTLLKSILYAFFGAPALETSLADTVTWGRKESELKVTLVVCPQTVTYTFTRSKNGAECVGSDGTKVTGQKEVSAFAAEILGADAKVSSSLMLSSQSGLRDSLTGGTGTVSGLMAKLANFDLIDTILKNADERLALGSVEPLRQRLASAVESVQNAKASFPDKEKYDINTTLVNTYRMLIDDAVSQEACAQAKVGEADDAVSAAERHNQGLNVLSAKLLDLGRKVVQQNGLIESATAEIVKAPGQAVLAGLREAVAAEQGHSALLRKYQSFTAVQYPSNSWEGSEQSFLDELISNRSDLQSAISALSALDAQVATLKTQIITNGKCPTCGKLANSDEHVAEHNAGVNAKIQPLVDQRPARVKAVADWKATVAAMESVQTAARGYYAALNSVADLLSLDDKEYPSRATWKGDVPAAQPAQGAAKRLADAEALQRAADVASGRREAAVQAAEALEREATAVKAQLDASQPIDLEPLKAAHQAAYLAYAEWGPKLRGYREELAAAETVVNGYEVLVARLNQEIASGEQRIAELQADITQTEANNVLVAKLKKIKPAITDHLWNLTLSAVSAFFSQMRGEPSVVTKDSGGFKVNGKSMDSLSGSTIDVLALATRVALTRTFVPHASFLVLDEPAHGADQDRTSNILGFLAGSGFKQTLLASHDPLSESVSNNLISLS